MAASLQAAATLMQPAKVGGLGRSYVQPLRSSQIVCKAFGGSEEGSGRLNCALQTGVKELAQKFSDAAKVAGFALATSALIASGANAEGTPKRFTFDELQSKTYLEVKGTGTANQCPIIDGGVDKFAFKPGKYNMKKLCLEPTSFTVKAESINKNAPPEFQNKLLLYVSSQRNSFLCIFLTLGPCFRIFVAEFCCFSFSFLHLGLLQIPAVLVSCVCFFFFYWFEFDNSESMARPTNSGEPDMATEDFNLITFPPSSPFLPTLSSEPPPSPPLYFPTSSNLMVAYQWSDQSSMDNPLQNQQQQPLTPSAQPISRTKPYAAISQSVSMAAAPTNSGDQSDMATEEYLIYWNSPSPSSNSMVAYYQGSGQSSGDNPLQNRQQQRPANSEDPSDMATDEHFDVTSLLNLPQWSPPSSPCSSANSMLLYQRSGQSFMDFVDRPLYIAGDLALTRQGLLQFCMDASEKWGPRGGIMSMNKENLPQSLECLGISLLHLYVEDEFDTLLYWPGELSWWLVRVYMQYSLKKLLQGRKFAWVYTCRDLEGKDVGQGIFGTERVTLGRWRIGPREWVAKIRYRRHSLESPFYLNERGQLRRSKEVYQRTAQVALEDARLNFHEVDVAVVAAHAVYVIDGRLNYTDIFPLQFPRFLLTAYPDEDFVNGEVELVRIRGEGTEEAEIGESELNPGPSRKKQRKEKTPKRERGNKKTTRVKNVIPLDKILQVKELRLKGAAELLKVSRSALKRTCREHGINRWPPRNKHEDITQSLPNETPAVVDQEGIPQLTSETLPSDQALTAIVDTNSVAEETTSQ